MIRFGAVASVVGVAVALLIVGALSGDLAVVYVSIGLAGLALVMLVIGVAVWRDQVFAGPTSTSRQPPAADQSIRAHPSPASVGVAQQGAAQQGAVQAGPAHASPTAPAEDRRAHSAAASGWPARPARKPVAPVARALPERDHAADRERSDRERDGRQPGPGGQPPAAPGRPGRQRDTASADRAGSEPSAASWPGQLAGREDRPGREPAPYPGRAQRRPDSAVPRPERAVPNPERAEAESLERRSDSAVPHPERAGTAESLERRSAAGPPYPAGEQPEPADDPTRLAHRLGIGRPADPAAAARTRPVQAPGSETEGRSPADPLLGPRPATSTRKPETRAGETEPAAAAAGTGPAPADTPAGPAGPPSPPRAATVGRETGEAAPADREPGEPAPAAQAVPPATSATPASGAAAESTPEPSPAATGGAGAVSQAAGQTTDAEVLVVPGIARYHQADCILIRFLGDDDLQRMSRQQAEEAGSVACRACRP